MDLSINLPNPSGRTVALGSTQPLTEMSTRDLPGGKYDPIRGSQRCCVCIHTAGPDLDKPVTATNGKSACDAVTRISEQLITNRFSWQSFG
jgi:hypothetical protein